MKTAQVTETKDLNYKNGYLQCKCGYRKEMGNGFNGYHIENCPECTPELETRTQRKVIYGDGKNKNNMTADIGTNIYFVLSNGIHMRHSFCGTSHTGLSLRKADKY